MINRVVITKSAERDLNAAPLWIRTKLMFWVDLVESSSLEQVRLVKGFHDEPLKGKRAGQRSIRLNRSYRAIYEIKSDNLMRFVSIEEVSKHEY